MRPSEMDSFLRKAGFVSTDVASGGIKWKHETYPDITTSYLASGATIDPLGVKRAALAYETLMRRRSADNAPQIGIVELPKHLGRDLEAAQRDDQVTFYYKAFPEFEMILRQDDFSEAGLTRSIRAVERQFQTTFNHLQETQANYNVKIVREDGGVFLIQPDADIRRKLDLGNDPEQDVALALYEIGRAANDYRDERELEFHELSDYGYEIEETDGKLIIKDPQHIELEEIHIALDFNSIVSRETKNTYGRLKHRYPSPRPKPIVVEAVPAELIEPEEISGVAQPQDEVVESLAFEEPAGVAEPEPLVRPSRILLQVPPVVEPESSQSIPTTIVEIPQERPMSAPAPTPIDIARPAARPSEVLLAKAVRYKQPVTEVAPDPYEETFGGRIVRHRNERNMTEQALAEAIKDVVKKQQSKRVTEDTIDEWQRNKAIPSSKEELDALTNVLIDKNSKIEDVDKAKARRDFKTAYTEARALFYNTPDVPKSDNFSMLVSRYRRQCSMMEGELAQALVDQLEVPVTEKLETFDYTDIARIQASLQLPSKGVVNAMIMVFNGANSGPLKVQPLEEEEKNLLLEAYETMASRMPVSKLDKSSQEPPVTPEAKRLRGELMAMFEDKEGPYTIAKIIGLTKDYAPLSYSDLGNHLSADRSAYLPNMSGKKIQTVKETLAVVLKDNCGADPVKLEEFSKRFDRLTDMFTDWRSEVGLSIGLRNDKVVGSVSEPA